MMNEKLWMLESRAFDYHFVVDGSLSTGHANSAVDMLSRLETMVLSGASLPVEVIRKQISSAIDIMVHLSRIRDRTRKVTEIHEMNETSDGEIRLNPLFLFEETGESQDRKVAGQLVYTGNPLAHKHKLQMAGKRLPLWFSKEGSESLCT